MRIRDEWSRLTAAAITSGVLQVEGLQRERFVEANGANLLTNSTAYDVCGCALSQESGRGDSDSEGCSLSSGDRSDISSKSKWGFVHDDTGKLTRWY